MGFPNKFGVQDTDFVMPGAKEFPKMVYKKDAIDKQGYVTRIVNSKEEEKKLPKDWLTSMEDIHTLLESLQTGTVQDVVEVVEEKPKAKVAG